MKKTAKPKSAGKNKKVKSDENYGEKMREKLTSRPRKRSKKAKGGRLHG